MAVGTALATEAFRAAPVSEAAAPLGVAEVLVVALPGPVVHEVLPACVAAAAEDEAAVAAEDEAAVGEDRGGSKRNV